MRVTKVLGSVVAVGVALVGLTATTEVSADPDPQTLVDVKCHGGAITATGVGPWHTNAQAPWKWDHGDKVKIDEHSATFKGASCTGTLKAYICSGEKCLGPIAKTVTER